MFIYGCLYHKVLWPNMTKECFVYEVWKISREILQYSLVSTECKILKEKWYVGCGLKPFYDFNVNVTYTTDISYILQILRCNIG